MGVSCHTESHPLTYYAVSRYAASSFLPPHAFRMHSSQIGDQRVIRIYKKLKGFSNTSDLVLSFCRNVLFSSKEVKNHMILNLSWGGMKGPYGSFPFVMIKIVAETTM